MEHDSQQQAAGAAQEAAGGKTSWDWLEDVRGDRSMEWVKAENRRLLTGREIEESNLYKRTLQVLDSKDKIPFLRKYGDHYYNFWQDEKHVRGLWRRCRFEDYVKHEGQAGQIPWELMLDVDALGKEEGQSWVYKGHKMRYPDRKRTLMRLSPGGSDAEVVREFDMEAKSFVPESEGGFVLPEAKHRVQWKDGDTLYVGTKFADASKEGLTDSGYPRIVKEWKRGTPISEARQIFEGRQEDVSIHAYVDLWEHEDPADNVEYHWIYAGKTFYTGEYFMIRKDGEQVRFNIPEDVDVSTYWDYIMIQLRKPWMNFDAGSLVVASMQEFLKRNAEFASDTSKSEEEKLRTAYEGLFFQLFEPTDNCSLEGPVCTKNYVVLSLLQDVKGRLEIWKPAGKGVNTWEMQPRKPSQQMAGFETVSCSAVETDHSDDLWVTVESFVMPSTLHRAAVTDLLEPGNYGQALRSQPKFFDATGVECTQHFVISTDGTRVPYFLVGKGVVSEESRARPTLQYGYGGFEISYTPFYSGGIGSSWLEKGGAFALASIRGGGEYGPKWHQAALKEKRPRAYEDFEAVAADLIKRGIATKPELGCMGGSNGGLLMGNMLVRPGSNELWNCIICQCPLLDMERYHLLHAGASWMAEYGDPDKEFNSIKTYSPYHMIRKGDKYPRILFTTSTKDDRVHPAHARKMVARLQELGDTDVWYYENIEGGHSGAADNKQRAFMKALEYTFLWEALGKGFLTPEQMAKL